MHEFQKKMRLAVLLATGLLPATYAVAAGIDRTVPADANGEVVVSNVSGRVEVTGWDRDEVQVKGTTGKSVERVDVESANGRTIVKVVLPRGSARDSDAQLEVRVPKNSRVEVTAVSADVISRGVLGTQRLKSVSGEVKADVAGDDSEVRSVSGDVKVRGSGKPLSLRVASVSGSLDISNVAGKIDLVTVSGDAELHAAELSEIRGRTTSGDMDLTGKLTRAARVDLEGVSGDISIRLSAPGGLAGEIESFSGDIEGCLAKNVERVSKYGPGKRLDLRNAEAGARVRVKTMSGDIEICDR